METAVLSMDCKNKLWEARCGNKEVIKIIKLVVDLWKETFVRAIEVSVDLMNAC